MYRPNGRYRPVGLDTIRQLTLMLNSNLSLFLQEIIRRSQPADDVSVKCLGGN